MFLALAPADGNMLPTRPVAQYDIIPISVYSLSTASNFMRKGARSDRFSRVVIKRVSSMSSGLVERLVLKAGTESTVFFQYFHISSSTSGAAIRSIATKGSMGLVSKHMANTACGDQVV